MHSRSPSRLRRSLFAATVAILLHLPAIGAPAPLAAPFDAAPFGEIVASSPYERIVRWTEVRKLRQVVVTYPGGAQPDSAPPVLSYWWRNWNGARDPVFAELDVGRAGWQTVDDWTNGEWKIAATTVERTADGWRYTFLPTATPEFPELKESGVTFRRTLMLKVSSTAPLPAEFKIRALTDAVERPVEARVLFGPPAVAGLATGQNEPIRVEVHNGRLLHATPEGNLRPTAAADAPAWTLAPNQEGSLHLGVSCAIDAELPEQDRTVVTVRAGARSFSFAPADVASGRPILIDDLGVLVTPGDSADTLAGVRRRRGESTARTVLDRVAVEPEQTLARAWDGMRLKKQLYFMHGLPGNRNAIRQDPEGQVRIAAGDPWFTKQPSDRDKNKFWNPQGRTFFYYFGFPDNQHHGLRELAEGYLPLLRMTWQDGSLLYEQRSILDKLGGDWSVVRVDDPSVLLMRVRVLNTSTTAPADANLFLTARGNQSVEKLHADGPRILADWQGQPRLRYTVDTRGHGALTNEAEGVRWRVTLQPGESCELDFRIPSITPSTPEDEALLRGHDFDRDSRRILAYWRAQGERGLRLTTPEPWLNDFHRAHQRHLLINCFKDFDTDDLFAHVGTIRYGAYPNESIMMTANLDERGLPDEARRSLESFLRHQGTVPLLGNFRSTEGLFYGAKGHEAGNYNKSHGYILWGLAQHWRMTRDRAWLERIAPQLVAGCDWIIRERQATMTLRPDGSRPIEYGFLPAGALEDVKDYWHWQATNSATAWGFAAAADALAEIGHPEAARLQREAQAYREDVLRGIEESRVRAPVVRLRDDTYVPYYPSRLESRGRAEGWVRETLEGPLHLLSTGLLAPDSPEADWILKDYEDNRFVSGQHGYAIPSFNRFWFSRGGFSMQANLLDSASVHLARDDIKAFLRAYFNSFVSGFFPEIRMLNEHALSELGNYQGDHFKTSDEAQSCHWLRLMFIREDGNDLYLAQGLPRYWLKPGQTPAIERAPTEFGELSLRLSSDAKGGRIAARLTPPTRNPPSRILLRFRHPEEARITRVTLNGRPHADFDAAKEWVVLPGNLSGPQEIVAYYEDHVPRTTKDKDEEDTDPFFP